MIASACVAAHLHPSAFGVSDPVDVALVAEEMLELLQAESRKAEMARMVRKLDGLG